MYFLHGLLIEQWAPRVIFIRFASACEILLTFPKKRDDNFPHSIALPFFMPISSRSGRESTTVLVADDEPAILVATAMYLKESGYNVLTAKDGDEALTAFLEASEPIQMVISDVVMPGMRGPQLLSAIKNLSPSTPTLLMSGSWTKEPGASVALLGKPFTRQKLIAKVQDMLQDCDFAQIEREQSSARMHRIAAIPKAAAHQPTD
jgi:DNA-binding NtrC family response regulator